MLILHLAWSLLVAVASSTSAWISGYSALTCLGLYMLGGIVGIVLSTAIQGLLHHLSRRRTESKGRNQASPCHPTGASRVGPDCQTPRQSS
jgi:hypothetical protein